MDSFMMITWNECHYLKSIRDNDQIPLDSSIQSIFNCHSIYGKCQYYRPAHFFHPKCGIHNNPQKILTTSSSPLTTKSLDQLHTFQDTFHEIIELQSNRELWEGQPPILIPFVSYMNEMKMAKTGKSFQRHNLSFIHVHKTGGTTIHTAMRDMNLYNGTKTISVTKNHHHGREEKEFVSVHIQHYKKMYDVYSQLRILRRSKIARETTDNFLNKAVRYQPRDQWDSVNPEDLGEDPSVEPPGEKNVYSTISKDLNHMMIALVRDPVERFISAVGQVTSTKFSKKGSGLKLKNACISSQQQNENESLSTSSILKCFVNVILEKGYWVDVHFTPMILEMSFATLQKDVPIALFHFDSLPDVVRELGLDPRIKKKNGKQKGYRQELLVNATVEDFDFDTLRDLCHLYLMDVLLMRDLGYSTHCDSIVFKN